MSGVRPINWKKPKSDDAERLLKLRAANTSNVIFTTHAFDRIDERSIVAADVYRIIKTGFVNASSLFVNKKGDWECEVSLRQKGEREAGVVTVIFCKSEKLLVKTVEWIDP